MGDSLDLPENTIGLDETAREILEAASRRFLHYGYGKTTMSEIAKDCNMSTGNLYRYFPAKMDIAESFVRQLRLDHIQKLKASIAKPGQPATEKLRIFLRLKCKLAYDRFHDRPKAFELSAEILNERHEIADEWERAEGALIAEVLDAGIREGQLPQMNTTEMARIIQDAVFRFTSPTVFHEGDCDKIFKELDCVIDVFLDAFAWRKQVAAK